MGKSADPPPPPDYKGAASATSEGSIQAAITNALLNQHNTSTPLGSQTWSQTGTQTVPGIGGQSSFDMPKYEQSIQMSPEGQGLYDQQMKLSTGVLGIGNQSLDQTKASLGSPQELGSVQDIADKSYGMQTARLDPQWQQNESMQKTALANQGLAPGGEAYDNSMRTFNQGKNDAYNQARLSSIATMPQTYQMSTAQRMQPLTELNAIRTGAQPQMPQFQATPAAGGAMGPNYMQAAQGKGQYDMGLYNSDVASTNSMNSGMMSLAGTAIGAMAMY